MIDPKRKHEIAEWVLESVPMSDTEVRELIIRKRNRKNEPPLCDADIEREVLLINDGGCIMLKPRNPLPVPQTRGERIAALRNKLPDPRSPQNEEEHFFAETVRAQQIGDLWRESSKALRAAEQRAKSMEPDAQRGRAVLQGGSSGGKKRAIRFEEKRRRMKEELKSVLRSDGGHISLTGCRKIVARRLHVSDKTVARHTREFSRRNRSSG